MEGRQPKDKVHGIQSVVVSIDGENVSISTHERDINNIVNKIRKPDQLLYAAAKVRLLVEQRTQNKNVQWLVNPTRASEYVKPLNENLSYLEKKSSSFDYHSTKIDIQSFSEKGITGHQLIEPAFNHSFTKIESDSPDYKKFDVVISALSIHHLES